jgi:hypothetical protein
MALQSTRRSRYGRAVPKAGLGSLVCLACIAAPARAEAPREEQPFTVALEYTAPDACPSAADFRSVVAKRLGYEPFREDASERVLVIVLPAASGLEGRFQWLGSTGNASGEQTFPSGQRDCGELVRTMGLALAVQIQLLATASEESAGTPPTTDDAGASAETKPPPTPPAPSPPASPPVVAAPVSDAATALPFLGAGVSAGFGIAPTVVPLFRVFGGVTWPHVMLELGGELSTRSHGERDDGAGFEQQLMLASIAACGTYARVSACALAKAGAVRVSARGVDEPHSPDGAAVELGLRLDYRQPLGAWGFVAPRASVLGNLNRWTITLDDLPVWRAPAVGAEAGIDAGVVFQ